MKLNGINYKTTLVYNPASQKMQSLDKWQMRNLFSVRTVEEAERRMQEGDTVLYCTTRRKRLRILFAPGMSPEECKEIAAAAGVGEEEQ